MLTIRDLTGAEEGLADFKELTLTRKVNGEKVISLTILPTKQNKHAFNMVEEESVITYKNEEYIIKKMNERSVGNTYVKRVEAIHRFFVDMINKQQPTIHNGSMTFNAFLSFVFSDTQYSYIIVDSFYAQSFENLGNDNRLSLLQKGLERYGSEMEIVGNTVRFKKKVGNDTDFQFRYSHNVKTIEKSVDTTNLSTVIQGEGAEGITASYTSPNVDIFGEIDAPPVKDERFTSVETLLLEMKSRLQDTPELSVTIDFTDLRASGYPYTVPNEGDRVFIIYEPMDDLLMESRIMEVTEVFNVNFENMQTTVTLANYKKTFAKTMFGNIQKQLRSIVNDDGLIKYSVLDESVRIATESLKNAQTELNFDNGIIAVDKTDPNKLVVYNSAGLGISADGGQTFKIALTGDGFVAETIVGEAIIGVNLASQNEEGIFSVNGSDAEFIDLVTGRNVKISPDGLFGYDSNGQTRFRADKLLVTSAALGTSNSNVYLAPDYKNEVRVVDVNSIPSDGVPENYNYRPIRALGLRFGPGANGYIGTEGEVRITSSGFTQEDGSVIYRPLRAGAIHSNNFVSTSTSLWMGTDSAMHVVNKGFIENSQGSPIYRDVYGSAFWGIGFVTRTDNAYVGANTELRVVNKSYAGGSGGTPIYRDVRASNFHGIAIDLDTTTNAEHLYVRPASSGVVRVTARGSTSTFRPIEASDFNTVSSVFYKKNIEDYDGNATEIINGTAVREYHMLEDIDEVDPKRVGLIVQEAPMEIVNIKGGESINLYAMASLLWKGQQETHSLITSLTERIAELEGRA